MSAEHAGTRKWKAKHSKGVKVADFTLKMLYSTIYYNCRIITVIVIHVFSYSSLIGLI